MTAGELCRLMSLGRYRFGHETLLQDDVEAFLRKHDISYKREYRLGPGDRVDFLVDGHIALEIKVRANRKMIYRQLKRYALHECIESLVLGTLTSMGLPPRIEGKPVYLLPFGRTGL